jgi:hypothetical protein
MHAHVCQHEYSIYTGMHIPGIYMPMYISICPLYIVSSFCVKIHIHVHTYKITHVWKSIYKPTHTSSPMCICPYTYTSIWCHQQMGSLLCVRSAHMHTYKYVYMIVFVREIPYFVYVNMQSYPHNHCHLPRLHTRWTSTIVFIQKHMCINACYVSWTHNTRSNTLTTRPRNKAHTFICKKKVVKQGTIIR